MVTRESVIIGGRRLTIETGRLAKQAGGAALVQYGESVVLVTATAAREPREGVDFFPLTVDYVEKTYSAGKIPGGYFKREGRLSTHETLVCRLIDRPIRPLFPDGFRSETQVIALVLSMDQQNDPSILALIGASAALEVSDIPFGGPVAAVRVGRLDGKLVINPALSELEASDLDLVMAVGPEGIVMVEGGAKFAPEADIVEALLFGQEQAQPILELQRRLRAQAGKPKRAFAPPSQDEALLAKVRAMFGARIEAASTTPIKQERYGAFDTIKDEAVAAFAEEYAGRGKEVKGAVEALKREFVRELILEKKKRIDGRGLKDIRPISCEVGVLPCTHGSALFTRGETQALVTLTLGTAHDEQRIEGLTGEEHKRFLLHYNFPPFSVGEVRFLRGPSRRDIGHGALAERGIEPALPVHEVFPYTVRLVSEVLESNGSSSMATVCGSSLAMMDGGMPLTRPVAGVAMGLIKDGRKVRILSDILGDEDHLGDMDFKVVGDKDGISALQMDIKIEGLSRDILDKALDQAREARLHVLGKMAETMAQPREDLSSWAPRITTTEINPDRIRDLIGPGGKNIRGIIEQTGVIIDVADDGKVFIAAKDPQAMKEALALVQRSTEEAEVGKIYLGRVTKTTDFGAFVQILPGLEGMVHISELSDKRVERVEDVVREQDEILVKVVSIDRQGKVRLSRREALGKQVGA
jgi:polyribonucleotide nucleotidyltransferase